MAAAGNSYFQKQFEITLKAEVIQTLRHVVLNLNREREELREFVSALIQPTHGAIAHENRRCPVLLRLSEPTRHNHPGSFELTTSLEGLSRCRDRIATINAALLGVNEQIKAELAAFTKLHPDWSDDPEIGFLVKQSELTAL